MQTLIQTIDSTGLYATVAQDYLYDNAGTAAREPISALRAKQDALTFGYDSSNNISAINSSAIAGGIPDDVAVSSLSAATGLSASGINIISAISSISGTYATKTELVDYQPTSSMTSYYTTTEVDNIVSRIGTFEIVSLTTATPIVPDVQDPNTRTVYLTKATAATVTDPYKEWIFTSADPSTTAWECIGDMSVDLSNYYTTAQANSRFCTETTAKKLADYAGGNGIVVAGDVYTTKSIASNLTEVPLQNGTCISVDVVTGGANDYVSISVKPEILLYQTTAPLTANSDSQIAFNIASNYTAYNTKSNNGTLGVANASITGLDASKMYNYNIKASVVATAAENVALKGPNWNNNYSWTSAYVNGNGTLELDCYIKGETSIEVSSYRSGVAEIGIIEASVTEVCDV